MGLRIPCEPASHCIFLICRIRYCSRISPLNLGSLSVLPSLFPRLPKPPPIRKTFWRVLCSCGPRLNTHHLQIPREFRWSSRIVLPPWTTFSRRWRLPGIRKIDGYNFVRIDPVFQKIRISPEACLRIRSRMLDLCRSSLSAHLRNPFFEPAKPFSHIGIEFCLT